MTTIDPHAVPASSQGAFVASVAGWVTTTDHKRLGRLHLAVAALVAVAALAVSALLSFERIDSASVSLELGGLTQMFSFARFGLTYLVMLPLVVGLGLAIVPLQLGARSLAFPRLAATGFWMWLIGGVLAIVSIAANGGPNGGNARFVDLFALSAGLVILGLLASLGCLAASIMTTRAPGLNMRRLPFFSWSVLVLALGSVVALPIAAADLLVVFLAHKYPSLSELSGNRAVGEWVGFAFTQPVTLLFAVPVLGLLGDVVGTATRTRLTPRGPILLAVGLAGLGVLSAAIQTPVVLTSGFSALSASDKVSELLPFLLVQVLPLLGTFLAVALVAGGLRTKPKVSAALVFALLGALEVLAGAAAGVLNHVGDAGLVGTTFEEGTWILLVGGVLLGAMGGVAHWAPKWWGRRISDKAALPLALLTFVGVELAAVPMWIAGFADQPGAVFPAVEAGPSVVEFSYSGPAELWNTLSTAGLALMLVSVLAFVLLAARSAVKGDTTGDDPWDGLTLEWATTSPAPADNFAALHAVRSAEPLLDLKPSTRSDA
ncbi:MAG: hypothetical protein RLZ04_836 [Actinomycetota bacterium]|jgi:heme/copper-type cytochrome/quinol oxidase subunit 1